MADWRDIAWAAWLAMKKAMSLVVLLVDQRADSLADLLVA